VGDLDLRAWSDAPGPVYHGVPAASIVRALLQRPAAAAKQRINEREIDVGIAVLRVLQMRRSAPPREERWRPRATDGCEPGSLHEPGASVSSVTTDDVAHDKPAPDPFLERPVGWVSPPLSVVEDSPMGLRSSCGRLRAAARVDHPGN
jgi:hypothetical protein